MDKNFDIEKAKKFLKHNEWVEKERQEQERITVFSSVVEAIKKLFAKSDVEVYLVGSITKPGMFHSNSDVDIVVKNFKDDRFDLWTQLEAIIQRKVEIIIFENCHFQDHVIKTGYKVL